MAKSSTASRVKKEAEDPIPRSEAEDSDGAYKEQTSLIAETAKAFGTGSTHRGKREEEYDEPSSQVTLSQTDEHIRQLESDGMLKHVVGSQSILSQELLCASQPEGDEEDDEEEEFSQSQFACSQQTKLGDFSQSQFEHTENSIALVRSFGLLTQEDEVTPSRDSTSEALITPSSEQSSSPRACGNSQKSAVSFQNDRTTSPSSSTDTSVAHSAKPSALRDTPVRESECFGSLLEAVQAITEREEVSAKLYALQYETHTNVVKEEEGASSRRGAKGGKRKATSSSSKVVKKERKRSSVKEEKESSTTTKNGGSSKRKAPPKSDSKSSEPNAKKARKASAKKAKDTEQRNAQEIAKRAATLAEQTVSDPGLAKKLLLSMALVRENPRTLPSTWPPRGSVVPEGFFWAHYPPLEGVLKKHMAEYYELSTTKCQSAQQQAFNNELVVLVRGVSKEQGWKFNKSFSDKSLRDRIRCYYKTHIQNAKKRLRTMVRNPTKKANARHLCSHLDLIEKYNGGGPPVSSDSDGETASHQSSLDVKPEPKPTKKPKSGPAPPPTKPRRKVSPASAAKDRRTRSGAKPPVVEV